MVSFSLWRKKKSSTTTLDNQAVLANVKEDGSLTKRMLTEDFCVDHSTVVRRLKELRKV